MESATSSHTLKYIRLVFVYERGGGGKEKGAREMDKKQRQQSAFPRRTLLVLLVVGLVWGYMVFVHSYNPLKWRAVINAKSNWAKHGVTFGLTEDAECCRGIFLYIYTHRERERERERDELLLVPLIISAFLPGRVDI